MIVGFKTPLALFQPQCIIFYLTKTTENIFSHPTDNTSKLSTWIAYLNIISYNAISNSTQFFPRKILNSPSRNSRFWNGAFINQPHRLLIKIILVIQ